MFEGLFSGPHLLILGFICLLIFGRRLPEIGRSMGKGITEFKKGLRDVGEEVHGQAQDPYQQNAHQLAAPQPPAQPYQQAQQRPYQPAVQQPQRLPAQPVGVGGPSGQPQVRVTRNDMVD